MTNTSIEQMRINLPHVWQIPWKHVYSDWETFDEMFYWALKHFGRDEFAYHDMQFLFKKEEDMMMFILRWA